MKEEKKGTTIFIVIIMIVLILVIALPPILRVMIKEETSEPIIEESQLEGMQSLICQRQVAIGTMIYNININSSYQNNTLNKVVLNYRLTTTADPTVTAEMDTVVQEMNTIRSTGLFTETSGNNSVRFEITKAMMDQNSSNPIVSNYNQTFDIQRANLQAAGYTCQVMTG